MTERRWLEKHLEAVKDEVDRWPVWMQEAIKNEANLRRKNREERKKDLIMEENKLAQ